MTNTNMQMVFREITAVCCTNYTTHTNTLWAKHGILILRQVVHTITGVTTVLMGLIIIIIIICPWTGISQESDIFGQERIKQNWADARFREVRPIFSRSWLGRPDTVTTSAFKSGIRNMKSLQITRQDTALFKFVTWRHCQLLKLYGVCRWNYTDRKTEVIGGKPVPAPFCPPQIPHRLGWDRNRASAVKRGRLIHKTAM
jgi:hypothetical protein